MPGSLPRRALVTGASGFLGGRLVAMLVAMLPAEGWDVAVLARASSRVPAWPGVRVVRADSSTDVEQFDELRTVTHVFHCAGCSTDWAPLREFEDGNVGHVRTLLKLARTLPALQRFVHVSTTDVYGYPEQAGDEAMPPRDTGLPYNRTKLRGEELVWAAARDGLPVTVVRPASIYGPGGKAFVTDVAAMLKQRLMLLVDGGRAPGGFVYVDDVCAAMLRAAVVPEALGQAYNLSSTDGVTWRTYTGALARALGLPAPWLSLPFGAAMALAGASEWPHRLGLPGRPLLTRHAVFLLGRNQQYGTAKARRELGWVPRVGLEEGVARSVRFGEKRL